MNSFLSAILLTIGLVCGSFGAAAQDISDPGDPAESKAAEAVATRFLKLIDTGKAAQTWALTGPILKSMTTQAEWEATLHAMRADTGALLGRKLAATRFTPKIDGAPDGHYYVTFFISKFAKHEVEEKIILNLKDKKWQVEGFFLTPMSELGK